MTITNLRLVDEPPPVRPHVVRLLAVTDIGSLLDAASPEGWKRQDGTLLTAEERELVGSANRQELLAGRAILEEKAEKAIAEGADMNRVAELTEPYFKQLGEGSTMGQVEKIMLPAERAELIELLERLTPKSTDDAICDLIEAAGRELADNMATGYTDGFEETLAKGLITGWDDAGRDALFEFLVYNKLDRLIDVDCLLPDTDESHNATTEMGSILIREIRRQDFVEEALQDLVEAAIVREAKYIAEHVNDAEIVSLLSSVDKDGNPTWDTRAAEALSAKNARSLEGEPRF